MKAQIHRLGNKIAFYVGNGDTVYIDRDTAARIAQALQDCATDVVNNPFARSEFKAIEIDIGKGKM